VSQSNPAGKVALVTWAAKRIGRSVAMRLASKSADVEVGQRASLGEGEEVVAQFLISQLSRIFFGAPRFAT
jgi:NAD(P)-dependent dehydrogenase (short-subunit alcohol dehydrogenase family)